MTTVTVTIPGTYSKYLAMAVANLAGFPEGSWLSTLKNLYNREANNMSKVIFYKDRMEDTGIEHPMIRGPDIVVTRVKENRDGFWKVTDEYIINTNDKVDPSVLEVSKLEKELLSISSE